VGDILRHYAEEVRRAGWTSVDSAMTATAGVYAFTRKNDAGHEWSLEIMATTYRGRPAVIDLHMLARQR
jgi:hypothetical protein